jgi:uncharacterized protein YhbP (UPF0306 family)
LVEHWSPKPGVTGSSPVTPAKTMDNKKENLKEISEHMKARNVMTLATSTHSKDLWTSTVYYGIDDDLNLYFSSNPKTKHAQQIQETGNVAFAISDSDQTISTKNKQGVYGQGTCTMLTNIKDITKGLKHWNDAHKLKVDTIPLSDFIEKVTQSKIYKVTPTKLKMFGSTSGEKEIEITLQKKGTFLE